jgi:hypothetical protein
MGRIIFSKLTPPPQDCYAIVSLSLGGKFITVKYSIDREEPIKLNEHKIPVPFSPWFVVGFCEA